MSRSWHVLRLRRSLRRRSGALPALGRHRNRHRWRLQWGRRSLSEDVVFYEKRSVSFRSLIGVWCRRRRRTAGRADRQRRCGQRARGRAGRLAAPPDGCGRGCERLAHSRDRRLTNEATLAASMEARVRSRAHAVLRTRRHRVQLGKSRGRDGRVRRQSRRVRDAFARRPPLSAGGHLLLPRRRHEQFPAGTACGHSATVAAGIATPGMRFFVVSLASLGANLLVLHVLIKLGAGKLTGQAIAIVLVTPLNFVGNKLWSFRRPIGSTSLFFAVARRLALILLCAFAVVPAARRCDDAGHRSCVRLEGPPDPDAAGAASERRASDEGACACARGETQKVACVAHPLPRQKRACSRGDVGPEVRRAGP